MRHILQLCLLPLILTCTILVGCKQDPAPKPPPKPKPVPTPEDNTGKNGGDTDSTTKTEPPKEHEPLMGISIRLESQTSVMRGAAYLMETQKADGSWSGHPGITAMCVAALSESPDARTDANVAAVTKALKFIRSSSTAEGKIKNTHADEDVYSAAVCLIALKVLHLPEDKDRIAAIRKYLVQSQLKSNSDFGYTPGSRYKSYPDLSNTHWALEAIRWSRDEKPDASTAKLWKRSAAFITSCQIKDQTNSKRYGGFLYYPIGKEPEKPAHKNTKEVWGSLTMGAMKSLLFADVKPDDARFKLGLQWVAQNYTVEKNPGLNQGGFYYYLYMFSSGMTFLKQDRIKTPDGKTKNWRQDLAEVLLSRQLGEGQWTNKNRLWMESDPALCTAYAMKALEFALRD